MSSTTQATRGTIGYTYDAADRPLTYSVTGGPTTTSTYYADGSLKTIDWSPVTGQFRYDYTLAGQYQTITMPNGQTRSYSYDDQGRLLQLANVHPTAGNLATYAYAYDLNHVTSTYNRLGQRVTMTADVPSQSWTGAVTKYSYDNNYQLTKAEYPNVTPFAGEVHQWTYDAIGNRLTSTVNTTTTNYTYQKIGSNPLNWQRLTSDGTNTYTYDGNGNATPSGYNFGYDRENRLVNMNVYPNQTPFVTYKYDYQGRRTSKTLTATTTYLYDTLNLVREIVGGTTNDYLFSPGIDEPLAIVNSGTVSYLVADALGSISGVTDGAGTVQNKYVYDVWGTAKSAAEAFVQPFRYTSREAGDLPTQSFYRARYYAPGLGRFLSEDPIRLLVVNGRLYDDFFHPNLIYSYVGSDPMLYTDPSGLRRSALRHPIDFLRDVHRRRSEAQSRRYPGHRNSGMRHCVITCETAREWGKWAARAVGAGNEVQGIGIDLDTFVGDTCNGNMAALNPRCRTAANREDLERNEEGLQCADCPSSSCHDCCSQKIPSHQRPPSFGDRLPPAPIG
jgi:RHS repeat-associated protein